MTTHPKREYTSEQIKSVVDRLYALHTDAIYEAADMLEFLVSQLAAQKSDDAQLQYALEQSEDKWIAAHKREGDAWCDASIPPNIPEGRYAYFWIAVRRKDSDKVVTFPAVYANAYPICSEDPGDGHGPHWSQVAVEYDEVGADILATGWYDIKVGEGYYDKEYQPVCSKGYVILAWCRAPEFVLANQPPPPDQDREVSP